MSQPPPVDLYREVHKGLRRALFAVTEQAGRADAANEEDLRNLQAEVSRVTWMLRLHATHEDATIQPLVEQHIPSLAPKIVEAHHVTEETLNALNASAEQLLATPAEKRTPLLHRLYLDIAAFTAFYVAHLGDEEIQSMPALTKAMSQQDLGAALMKIRGAIAPEDMGKMFRVMCPAMNVNERAGMLTGIKMNAPPPAFERMRAIAEEVLPAADYRALATRLGLG
jgi:hypothetical protein